MGTGQILWNDLSNAKHTCVGSEEFWWLCITMM